MDFFKTEESMRLKITQLRAEIDHLEFRLNKGDIPYSEEPEDGVSLDDVRISLYMELAANFLGEATKITRQRS